MSKKAVRLIKLFLIAAAIVLGCYFVLPRLIKVFLPFIIAFLIAYAINPIVGFLRRRLKIPKGPASAICVIVVTGLLLGIVFSVVHRVSFEIGNLYSQRHEIGAKAMEILESIQTRMLGSGENGLGTFFMQNLDIEGQIARFSKYLAENLWPAVMGLLGFAKSLPGALIFFVVMMMSAYFMSSDSEKIFALSRRVLPGGAGRVFGGIKNDMTTTLWAYIRTQLFLMLITFLVSSVGLALMGRGFATYALLMGLIIALLDMLPILGTGGVYVPWALYLFFTGAARDGVVLLVIYGICLATRQMVEPRMIGKKIGIHPLLTLIAMYAGFQVFGFWGIIGGPVLAIVLRNLYFAGVFTRLKNWINEP